MGMTLGSVANTSFTAASLSRTNRQLGVHTARLSSGYRINSAGDDPAGYAISENLSALILSTGQATRNTNDGISFVNVAEDASKGVGDMLLRAREIAVQASSGTLSSSDRTNLTNELSELVTEIGRIASNTEFNDIQLTDGTNTSVAIQVGVDGTSNDQISITLGDLTTSTLGVSSLSISSTSNASSAITTIDTAIDSVNGYRASYGATTNRLEAAVDYTTNYSANLSASRSSIRDADFAQETADRSKLLLMQQSAIAVLAQQIKQSDLLLALI